MCRPRLPQPHATPRQAGRLTPSPSRSFLASFKYRDHLTRSEPHSHFLNPSAARSPKPPPPPSSPELHQEGSLPSSPVFVWEPFHRVRFEARSRRHRMPVLPRSPKFSRRRQ